MYSHKKADNYARYWLETVYIGLISKSDSLRYYATLKPYQCMLDGNHGIIYGVEHGIDFTSDAKQY